MKTLLSQYSNEALFSVFNYKKLHDAENKFGKEKMTELSAIAKYRYEIKHSNHAIIQAIAATLYDSPSYPLVLFWTILTYLAISALPLTFIAIGISALTCVTGNIFFLSTYREVKKEIEKSNDFFKLATTQLVIADELIERQYILIDQKNNVYQAEVEEQRNVVLRSNFSGKNTLPKINQAISTSMLVGSMLFGTYYLGLSGIISAFGFSAAVGGTLVALGGPVGFGIALAVSFAIASYVGYKHYQVYKNNSIIDKQKKEISNIVEKKYHLCAELKEALLQQQNAKNQASLDQYRKPYPVFHRKINKLPYHFANYPMILANQRQTKRTQDQTFLKCKKVNFKRSRVQH